MQLVKNYFPIILILLFLSCKNKVRNENQTKPLKKQEGTCKDITIIHKNTTRTDSVISTIDTGTVLSSFKSIVKTAQFRKELQLVKDGSVFDSERHLLIGDINEDHLADAIMPFSIEGRGGGNN
jgi:hypothetical protein